uniref:Uncharacterized protein n=1 Tax=Arundo donax TaxID=35708 RepID=A0A0A9J2L6_ARUDO
MHSSDLQRCSHGGFAHIP